MSSRSQNKPTSTRTQQHAGSGKEGSAGVAGSRTDSKDEGHSIDEERCKQDERRKQALTLIVNFIARIDHRFEKHAS
jgi:hypothetical protein